MKRMRSLLCLLTVLALLAGCAAFAEAKPASQVINEKTMKLDVQNMSVDDRGAVRMTVYGGKDNLRADDIFLRVGNISVNTDSIEPFGGTTTWLFLVDTATVSTKENKEPIRDTLTKLIDAMGPKDEAAILTTGDTQGNYPLQMRQKLLDGLKKTFGSISINKSVTNLYETMGKALDFLENRSGEDNRGVLVVISNGQTENDTNMPYADLIKKIQSGKATIYTIAYKRDKDNTNAQNRFFALAQASRGGIGLKEEYDEKAYDVAAKLHNNEACFYVARANAADAITAHLKSLSDAGDRDALSDAVASLDVVEEITLCGANGAQTPLSVSAEQWKKIRGKVDVPEIPEEDAVAEVEEKTTNFLKDNWTIIALCAVILLAVILIIVLLARGRRDRAPRSNPASRNIPESAGGPPEEPKVEAEEVKKPEEKKPVYTEPDDWTVQVALTEENGRKAPYMASMANDELSIGRKAEDIDGQAWLEIDNGDAKISRKHVLLRYSNSRMILVDMSRNGTWVNDVRVTGPTELHQNDKLTMGKSKFRIVWRFK